MDRLALQFLPFPHVYKGKREEGAAHKWPDRCNKCDRQCEANTKSGIQLCSFGVNFLRIDEDLLIAGVVLKDFPQDSVARGKMLRTTGKNVVPSAELLAMQTRAAELERRFVKQIDSDKSQILADYIQTEGYKDDIVKLLEPSLKQTFAQVHDYRQLVTQIVQNVNVILESEMPGEDLDHQLDHGSDSLRAIYWAARLMEFKLDSALFLAYPERITDTNKKRGFRFHGAVKKYVSIYAPVLEQRRLRLRETGSSFGNLHANPDAVGVIPHAFLDNAIKYAPDGSEVELIYEESDRTIVFQVRSLGPKIAKDEEAHIFELFFRGQTARESGEDGTGFGLGLAQHVASELGVALSVHQERASDEEQMHRTTFRAEFLRPTGEERTSPLVRARKRTRGGGLRI